jgi:hypothetical protein
VEPATATVSEEGREGVEFQAREGISSGERRTVTGKTEPRTGGTARVTNRRLLVCGKELDITEVIFSR